MRPSATESLYKDMDTQEGVYEYNLPAGFCIRPLRLADLDQVMELEAAGFPEEERATKEKIVYRLQACPELCAGVFVREFNWPPEDEESSSTSDNNTTGSSAPTNSDFGDDEDEPRAVAAKGSTLAKEKLVGHIIATKTASKHVTDASMAVGGHDEGGQTIAVHSVVVHPDYQGHHIGYVMMKDYVQKFFGLCTAEQMSLLAHKELIPFYRKHGFKDEGPSESAFAGQSWRALRLPFDTYDDVIDEL